MLAAISKLTSIILANY